MLDILRLNSFPINYAYLTPAKAHLMLGVLVKQTL